MVSWHVVQTEPQREFAALHAIANLPGLKPWLPTEVHRRKALRNGRPVYEHGQRVTVEAIHPLFRGYLLVAFDAASPCWAPLMRRNRETRTVKLFCDTAWRPLTLPESEVAAWQARGRAGDGAIDMEDVELPPLANGARVTLPGGPWAGIEAVVQSSVMRRVEILMGLLRVTVDRGQVEVVA